MSNWLKGALAVAFVAGLTMLGCALAFEPQRDELWVLALVVLFLIAVLGRSGSWDGLRFGILSVMAGGAALFFVGAIRTGVLVATQFGADGWTTVDLVLFATGVLPIAVLGGVFAYGAVRTATLREAEDDAAEGAALTGDVRA